MEKSAMTRLLTTDAAAEPMSALLLTIRSKLG